MHVILWPINQSIKEEEIHVIFYRAKLQFLYSAGVQMPFVGGCVVIGLMITHLFFFLVS